MPHVTFVIDGEAESFSDAYVIGRVVDVVDSRSSQWNESGPNDGEVALPFNDASADTSNVRLSVEVERSLVSPGAGSLTGTTISVGLVFDAPVDLAAVRDDLVGRGTVVMLLWRESPVFAYAAELWSIVGDGALLGDVTDDGQVSFPALATSSVKSSGLTIEQLEQPAGELIEVSWTERGWVRDP